MSTIEIIVNILNAYENIIPLVKLEEIYSQERDYQVRERYCALSDPSTKKYPH